MVSLKHLGSNVRNERIKLGMTQERLAIKLQVSSSYIGAIERGERSMSLDTITDLCEIFGCSISHLLRRSTPYGESGPIWNPLEYYLRKKSIRQQKQILRILRTIDLMDSLSGESDEYNQIEEE